MNIKEIKKGVRISKKISTEANLYLYNGILYKIFNNPNEIENKENVLNALYKTPIDGCSYIYNLLYDDYLIGYSMEYYKNYKDLKNSKRISFELKKLYCHKMIDLYKKLRDLGYIYYDFHKQNILINHNDLKLIDIDSCLDNNKENNSLGMKYLNELVLSLIFNTDIFEYITYFSRQGRKEILDIIYSDLSYDYIEDGSLEELDDYVCSVDEKHIKKIKKELPKSILK